MPALADTLLDRTIVGGYSSLGYRLRRRWWEDGELARMDGQVVIVTGATSGLGLAAAVGFAVLGAHVVLAVRSAERGAKALADVVRRSGSTDVEVAMCDLASLRDVRRFAAAWRGRRVDVLVNNAGALPPERTLSPDGNELTLATNVLGPHLLTHELLESLRLGAPGRVINISSGGMYTQKLDVEHLQNDDAEFDGTKAYARTKRAEVVLTELWAERLDPAEVVVHAMHPGWADTPGLAKSLPGFHRLAKPLLRSPEQGADTIVWLGAAAEPAQSSGEFWHDRAVRPRHYVPWTRESAEDRVRLWEACCRLSQAACN